MEAAAGSEQHVSVPPREVAEMNASISYYFIGILGELKSCAVALQRAIDSGGDQRRVIMYMLALVFGSQRFLASFKKHAEHHLRWRMHEMNNRFMVIFGNLHMLLADIRLLPAEVVDVVHAIDCSIADLERIVDQRSGFHDVEYVELASFTQHSLESMRVWMKGVEVQFLSERHDVTVCFAKSGFEMTISNLLTNSVQAKARKIEVILATEFIGEDALATLDTWNWRPNAPGMFAVLEVTDDGTGMSRDVQHSVFAREVSTKDSGWGVGLYGVGKFLASCGGGAQVERSSAGGTVMRLYFPLAVS